MTDKTVVIHSDGACSGNPGPGGWGAVLVWGEYRKEISGGEAVTTNNRMELMGAIMALEALKQPSRVAFHTDSAYVKNGITAWIHGWKKNGWRTAAKGEVKNADLWRRLDEALAKHVIEWKWVKGHAGDVENERADKLARDAMAPFKASGGLKPSRSAIDEAQQPSPPHKSPSPLRGGIRGARKG